MKSFKKILLGLSAITLISNIYLNCMDIGSGQAPNLSNSRK